MSDTTPVYTVGLWQRIKLFFRPPTSIQADCLNQPWVGVTEEWCGRVKERFDHQERRAVAMAMLERQSSILRGESATRHLLDNSGLMAWNPTHPTTTTGCSHDNRIAEHVQYCCDCQTILARNELAMVLPEEIASLRAVNAEMNAIALWMRTNMDREITRGDHAGKSDSEIIIGYLSRLKS